MKHAWLFCILTVASLLQGAAQPVLPYKNPQLPIAQRVQDLLSRMTPEEKFWQLYMIPGHVEPGQEALYKNGLFGFQFSADSKSAGAAGQLLAYNTSENALALVRKINAAQKYFIEKTRLGIPVIPFDEALHGLVREGATVFPQAIGLAATWDTALMRRVASAITAEAKIRGIRQVLSPVINIATDVRWGRVEETYGEDPFLTAEMAVAFVTPFEKAGIITTPKHFIANVGDGGRDSYPIYLSERNLEEVHFPPFKACLQRGGSRSVMSAYNSVDGIPATANNWLLNKKLKGEWQFKGFVISDASAVGGANVLHFTSPDYPTSSAQAINGGLDVIFQTQYAHHTLFDPPFFDGRIPQKTIDEAVARILTAKFELGLFEHPYVAESDVTKGVDQPAHKALAKEAALKSIVLLKNEKNILPLKAGLGSIAMIGTDAATPRLGGYSGPGNQPVSILTGIKELAGQRSRVLYAPGCGIAEESFTVIPGQYLHSKTGQQTTTGLTGEYFTNITLSGQPAITRTDKQLQFQWTLGTPGEGIDNDFYSIRWTGTLKAPRSGRFKIGLEGNDGFRLYINNNLVIDRWFKQTYSTCVADMVFEQNREYAIRIEFFEPVGNAHIKLVWNATGQTDWQAKIAQAVAVARQADVAVIVAGIHEGEFQDRASLALPGHQETLIQQVAATGKPIIVVLVGGSAITMTNWLAKAPAVLSVWYPGEEGGRAVADVLFGKYNPAGRLPVTFPVAEAQLPLVYNHKPTGRGDDYYNLSGLPLFPFGYGLSYTRFAYSDIRADKKVIRKTDSVTIRCHITNTGTRGGEEVVQLYIRDKVSSVATPVMALKGFQRIYLAPGEQKEVTFTITPEKLSLLNEQLQPVVEPGDFRIMIGSSSLNIALKETIRVTD